MGRRSPLNFADTWFMNSPTASSAGCKSTGIWRVRNRQGRDAGWLAPAASGPLASPKFLEAIFSSDATRDKRNTKAIDLGANELVAGRVVRYAPAAERPLVEVKEQIRVLLASQQASALARKTGEARLAALKAAPTTALAGEPEAVSRASPRDVPRPLLDALLKAPATALPAFVGVDLGDPGYAIAKVVKVSGTDPAAGTAEQLRGQYMQLLAEAETRAYYDALKKRYKVVLTGAIDAPADPAVDSGAGAPPR